MSSGIAKVRDAFQRAAGPDIQCVSATLRYVNSPELQKKKGYENAVGQWQALVFTYIKDGKKGDSVEVMVQPGADLCSHAAEAGAKLYGGAKKDKGVSQN